MGRGKLAGWAALRLGSRTDSPGPIFQNQLEHYRGKTPFEMYPLAEGGVMAMQGWNKQGMTLIPCSNFSGFMPEDESGTILEDAEYSPATPLTKLRLTRGNAQVADLLRLSDAVAQPTRQVSATLEDDPANESYRLAALEWRAL